MPVVCVQACTRAHEYMCVWIAVLCACARARDSACVCVRCVRACVCVCVCVCERERERERERMIPGSKSNTAPPSPHFPIYPPGPQCLRGRQVTGEATTRFLGYRILLVVFLYGYDFLASSPKWNAHDHLFFLVFFSPHSEGVNLFINKLKKGGQEDLEQFWLRYVIFRWIKSGCFVSMSTTRLCETKGKNFTSGIPYWISVSAVLGKKASDDL